MCFKLALNASCQLQELLLVDCSTQLDRPQRRFCPSVRLSV